MAQNFVNNNYNSTQFPFEFVSSEFGGALGRLLRCFEEEDVTEAQPEFVAALNTVLVWSGARTATLPSWEYFQPNKLMKLIKQLNKWSQRVPQSAGTIRDVVVIRRRQIYRCGNGIQQEMIARQNCGRVRVTSEAPVTDEEIGLEMDMYPANVKYFVNLQFDEVSEKGFSIWEVGTNVLLYAEAWSVRWLSESELLEFLPIVFRK